MPENDAPRGKPAEDDSKGRIWRGLKALLFGDDHEPTLREQIEEVIDEHEEDGEEGSAANGDLSRVERQMLKNLLHFSEHRADDVAVPRSDIVAIEEKAAFADCVALFAEHGHSRVPVYRDTLDEVIGFVHIKDIFAVLAEEGGERPDGISRFIRQPRFVPETMGVLDLLADMRAHRTHLAIVLDEYSGTEGLVTIEDLVEEIVGEIEDEHDDEPEAMVAAVGERQWDADARVEIDDLAEALDPPPVVPLPDPPEGIDTLGGLAFVLAGRVPQPGERLEHDSGWTLEILDGDEKRVTRIRLTAPEPAIDPLDI